MTVRISSYTRQADASKKIKTLENGDEQFFVIRINHNFADTYKAHWEMATHEHRNGYTSVLTIPTADYNGQTTLKTGRFNRKWLEKADLLLNNNIEKYFNLWNQEKYQELCNEIHTDIANM